VAKRDRSSDLRVDAQRHRLDLDLRSVMSGQSVILFRRGEACLALLPHLVLWIEGDACVAPTEKFCVIPACRAGFQTHPLLPAAPVRGGVDKINQIQQR
jgi:hypothetical protein